MTAEVGKQLVHSERTVKNIVHDLTSRLELRNGPTQWPTRSVKA